MSLPDLHRPPSAVYIQSETDAIGPIAIATPDNPECLVWQTRAARVSLAMERNRMAVFVAASSGAALRRVYLRWDHRFGAGTRILGDAWERSYGELEWRGVSPHRPLPWYFLATNQGHTAGYGVITQASSIACWKTDTHGVTLELDVRSGGVGVQLGSRRLHAATIVQRLPQPGESPFAAARGLCRALCPAPLMPRDPVVGHNDWYWLYGKNSETKILDATRRFMDLYPTSTHVRPWSVIDDGWQATDGPLNNAACNGGPWERGTTRFPDLPGLAENIKSLGARPGIWMRPLLTREDVPSHWKLACPKPSDSHRGNPLDPSHPDVRARVHADITRLRDWGFEMIKHDFSTFDVTGRWGFGMNAASDGFAPDGWAYADRTRTTAEILVDFYKVIREAAGPGVTLIGCNTVGHLAAGLVEIQRTGDDTSATDWDRTRRMGVNTLAFRAAQHGAFFAVDADCVPVSPHVPPHLTMSWLDLVARSGTPLFVSIDPDACDETMNAALRNALEAAARPSPVAEPLDWLDTTIPASWKLQGTQTQFRWSEWTANATPAETTCS